MERNRLGTSTLKILFGIAMFSIVASYALIRDTAGGGGALTPVSAVANPCPRPAAGSAVHNPPALFSSDGVLNVRFSYEHSFDTDGTDLFCFMTPDGLQNPTLHVKAGGALNVTLTNADNDLGPAELRGHANGQILGQHPLSWDRHSTHLSVR